MTDSTGDMLRETAQRLFQAHCDTATLRAADQGTWPAALWVAIEEAGLTRALVPEAAGGFGVTSLARMPPGTAWSDGTWRGQAASGYGQGLPRREFWLCLDIDYAKASSKGSSGAA